MVQPTFDASVGSGYDMNKYPLLQGHNHWIGLRENLQENMVFTIKYGGFPVNFPLNQPSDINDLDT